MENTTKKVQLEKGTADKKEIAELFKGVDEDMELGKDDQQKLMEFETVNKDGKDIEFDKVQLKDLAVKVEHRRIPGPRHRFAPLK